MKLSIVIPVYNEEATIVQVLQKVFAVALPGWEREVVVVDDGSRDSSKFKISAFVRIERTSAGRQNAIKFISHDVNQGKGAAIRTALEHVTGDAVIIQDADLEYDPADWPSLLKELENLEISVVYGSRNINPKQRGYSTYVWGVAVLTWLVNLFFKTRLTDVYSGYKLFRTAIIKSLACRSRGFEFEMEVTCKLLKRGYRITEAPISYYPRKFQEGKKIRARDGLAGVWTLLLERFG